MTDIIDRLKEPEAHYPGNFDTPKRANAMLSCLCQDAAEEIEALRKKLEMAEACLAGDNALIAGLKDDIEELRKQLAEKGAETESYKTSYEETYAQNLRLAEQLGESESELIELRRKIAIYQRTAKENSGESVDAMIAQDQIAELRVEVNRLKRENQKLALDCLSADGQAMEHWQQLAASQAREQRLREALSAFSYRFPESSVAKDALAAPTDTTALQAYVTKAGEVMRERCRKVAFDMAYADSMAVDVSQSIRALPAVTLSDLK